MTMQKLDPEDCTSLTPLERTYAPLAAHDLDVAVANGSLEKAAVGLQVRHTVLHCNHIMSRMNLAKYILWKDSVGR